MSGDNQVLLSMSELAELCHVSQRVIHLHEERGLIESVRTHETGNRYFKPDTVKRLKKITQLQAIGLTIKEIAEILPLYMDESDHGIKGKKAALQILHNHLEETQYRLTQLNDLKESIIKSIARLELLIDVYSRPEDSSFLD